jgi:acetolactate synthase-1/2/3 large subunit
MAVPGTGLPDPAAVDELAERIATASCPVVVTSASGADPTTVELLGGLCDRFAMGVAEMGPRCVNVAPDHALHLGSDLQRVFDHADLVLILESDVPWMPTRSAPRDETFIAQVGVDPLFTRYPMRTHRSDLTIAAGARAFLLALTEALEQRQSRIEPARYERLAALAGTARAAVDTLREREVVADGPITKAFLSLTLGEVLDEDAVVFNEYWGMPELLGRRQPGTYFFVPPAGGLGWGLPAALGARHAAPGRTVVAAVGDGAYLFANPAACHHASAKHNLPVLTVVADNARWGAVDHATRAVYPDGLAVRQDEDRLSDLSPSPAFEAYCAASGGHGERVTQRDELRPALERALHAVQDQGRQALVSVDCA